MRKLMAALSVLFCALAFVPVLWGLPPPGVALDPAASAMDSEAAQTAQNQSGFNPTPDLTRY